MAMILLCHHIWQKPSYVHRLCAFTAAAVVEKQATAQVEVHRPATPARVQVQKKTPPAAAAASFPPIQTQKQEAPATVRASQELTAVTEARRPAAPSRHMRTISLHGASQIMWHSPHTMRTKDGVVVYNSIDKVHWQITPVDSTKALLIGGSNLRRFSSVPPGWEVHCLSGAKLWHVNSALEHLQLQVPEGDCYLCVCRHQPPRCSYGHPRATPTG